MMYHHEKQHGKITLNYDILLYKEIHSNRDCVRFTHVYTTKKGYLVKQVMQDNKYFCNTEVRKFNYKIWGLDNYDI